MKRILITTGIFPPDIGGPASYGVSLANKLSKDFSVTLLTYSSISKSPEDKAYPFKVKRVWRGWQKGMRHIVFLVQAITLAGKADRIVALNSISAGIPAILAGKFHKKSVIIKVVGDAAWEKAMNSNKTNLLLNDFQKSGKKGLVGLMYKLQSWACKNAHSIIVPSEYLAGIVEQWGISRDKIHIVYNGVDIKPSSLSDDQARKNIGVMGHVILSIGRLVPWKGFRMLIKMMPQVLAINQAFRLVIVGDGPDRDILSSMIKNLGLERKVFLVGKKGHDDIPLYFAAANMFVLDTGYEGFSHLVLEAMACGVPVITTAVGGNKEIVTQGENGFLVKYNDEFNLIEAIRTLWQNNELREEFIKNGKQAASRFTIDKMLSETVTVIQHV